MTEGEFECGLRAAFFASAVAVHGSEAVFRLPGAKWTIRLGEGGIRVVSARRAPRGWLFSTLGFLGEWGAPQPLYTGPATLEGLKSAVAAIFHDAGIVPIELWAYEAASGEEN